MRTLLTAALATGLFTGLPLLAPQSGIAAAEQVRSTVAYGHRRIYRRHRYPVRRAYRRYPRRAYGHCAIYVNPGNPIHERQCGRRYRRAYRHPETRGRYYRRAYPVRVYRRPAYRRYNGYGPQMSYSPWGPSVR